MSFGGSVQAMITSINNNAMLLRKRSIFKRERSFLNLKDAYFKASKGTILSKKLSSDELKAIRTKVIASQKKEFLFDLLVFVLFGVLFIGFIVAIGSEIYKGFQNPYYKNLDIKIENTDKSISGDQLQFYIQDAEKWMQEFNYTHAAFQYKNALEIAPNNSEIEVKYVEAVVNQCYFDKTNCELAHSLLQKAAKKYPENKIIIDLLEIIH